MNANFLTIADALSDQALLARIPILAAREREAAAELVAHLAVLDTRPALYAAQGYGSLFGYCTQGLGLSEDAACNRVAVARACRRFPVILDLLVSGSVTLTSMRPDRTGPGGRILVGRTGHAVSNATSVGTGPGAGALPGAVHYR